MWSLQQSDDFENRVVCRSRYSDIEKVLESVGTKIQFSFIAYSDAFLIKIYSDICLPTGSLIV